MKKSIILIDTVRTAPVYNADMGRRGRLRREQLGVKLVELASILDLGTTRISQMERDGVDGIKLATRWAHALGLDPQDLVFGCPKLDRDLGMPSDMAGVRPAAKTAKKRASKR